MVTIIDPWLGTSCSMANLPFKTSKKASGGLIDYNGTASPVICIDSKCVIYSKDSQSWTDHVSIGVENFMDVNHPVNTSPKNYMASVSLGKWLFLAGGHNIHDGSYNDDVFLITKNGKTFGQALS